VSGEVNIGSLAGTVSGTVNIDVELPLSIPAFQGFTTM
jgi:hypothetical protein